MHVPDHAMDPATCIATTAISIAAVGYAGYRVYRDFPQSKTPLLGVVAAWVFAAQMFNFPISGGTSGHLLGAVLAAIMLGPWAGLLAVTAVLAVQCFLFQDGGITALGANVLNMGVAGSLIGFAIYDRLRTIIGGKRGTVLAAATASWTAVLIGAALCSAELAAGGGFAVSETLGMMLSTHALIGLGEAAITSAAVATLLNWRPALVTSCDPLSPPTFRLTRTTAMGLAMAVVLVLLAAPLASTLPDGLETSLAALGHAESPAILASPMSQYSVNGISSSAVQAMLAGLIGIAAVLALSGGVAAAARVKLPR